jgi:hypothetical protein
MENLKQTPNQTMPIDPVRLEQIRLSQLASWEANKGTIPLAPKQDSLAHSAVRRQLRSLGARLLQIRKKHENR